MKAIVFAVSLIVGTILAAAEAAAETGDCRAQLQRQDEQCQILGEKLEAACPGGQNIKDNADCRQISTQIANSCTRKPCAPPPRKAKGKGKAMGKGMGKGMGKATPKSMKGDATAKKAKRAAPTGASD